MVRIMMKNLFKICFKCILCTAIFASIWFGLTPYFRIDKNIDGDQFRNLPKNSIDVLVLGSSHAQYSMNPAVFYVETGIYSYVLGSGCQPMTMSYYMLQEALKTQSPEVVVLDVFTMMPAQAVCYGEGMFYVAIDQMTGFTRLEAADNIDNEEKIQQYKFDLLMNHGNWKRDDFLFEDTTDLTLNETLGHVPMQPTEFEFKHVVPRERGDTNVQLKQKDVDALLRIKQLCDENGIQLVLIKAIADIDQENYDTLQAIWDVAKENNIEYVDFIALAEEIGFTFGMNGDTWHNNSWGAERTSKYLANYLKEKGYIQHHKENSVLEDQLKKLRKYTGQALMQQNLDIYQLLRFAAKYDVTLVVKYSGWHRTTITDHENNLLNMAGIHHDFIEEVHKNYYAVIENGVVLVESEKKIETVVRDTKIVIDEQEIKIGENEFDNLGELEIIFCGNNFTWFNEIPIDYAARFFWKNGCDGWVCEVQ